MARRRSVRDFPVSASVKGDAAVVTTRVGRDVLTKISVTKREWDHPIGGAIGNPDYDRRQMVGLKLVAAGAADFGADGAETPERIADAHMSVLKKVWAR
jgi:hypothetical protein